MDNNKRVFEELPVAKAVRTMALPTVAGQLIILIYNIADTFFIGRTNDPLMVAGASLILPVFNISLSIAGITGVGGGALISRLLGEKRPDEARKVYSFSIYVSVLAAALFSAGAFIFMKPMLNALGARGETFEYARSYAFWVIVCGGIPTVLSNVLSTLLRSVGESKKSGVGIMMGGLINIALDPLFMFVLLPEGKEIVGAGVATCLSNCIAAAYFIVVILRMRENEVLRIGSPAELPEKSSAGQVFGVGVPSAVTTLLFDLDYIIIGRLMSAYGGVAVAAVGIVLKAERLPLNVGVGLCQGMMPIVGYNYSAKNIKRMNDTKRCTLIVGLVCAAASIALYEIFAGGIMGFFIRDAETVALGTTFLRIRVLATPLMFLSFFHVFLFNGIGRGNLALFLGVMRWVAFNIPMLYLLNSLIGMNGIVWSQVTADTLTVILSFIVYRIFENKNLRSETV